MSRAQRATAIQTSIREVLFRHWDPLLVNENTLLVDEYDSHIAPVYRVLTGNRSAEALIDILSAAEPSLGANMHSPEQLRVVVAKLLALDVKL